MAGDKGVSTLLNTATAPPSSDTHRSLSELVSAQLRTFKKPTAPAQAEKLAKDVKSRGRDGDSEVTEPESDEDSLLGAGDTVSEDMALVDAGPGAPSPDALSSRELIERRMSHLEELRQLYTVEYWGLLEELRTRHHHFLHKQKPHDRAGQPAPVDSPAMSSIRAELGRRTSDSKGDTPMPDAAVSSVRNVPQADSSTGTGGAQMPNPFLEPQGDEARGSGSEEQLPHFAEVEVHILRKQGKGYAAPASDIQKWQAQYRRRLPRMKRLEQAASASSGRELDRLGALACLCGRQHRFLVKSTAVSLGRATEASQVDIDLGEEADARKVSRHQAHLLMHADGRFWLKNVGRRTVLVNNRRVDQGQAAQLDHLSLVEVGGVCLLFMANQAAVKRAILRSTQFRT